MNCSKVQQLLSAYYDGELANDQRSRVSDHIDICADCAKDLAGFENLSSMADAFSTPVSPEPFWNQLEQRLNSQHRNGQPMAKPISQLRRRAYPSPRLIALATTVLVVVGIGCLTYQSWIAHHGQGQFTVEFGRYLDEFDRDPIAAQETLLAKYENQLVDADHATERVGYRPGVADGLPKGYSVESTYVMKMPCCTCVQCLCKRSDGSSLAIFEHDDEGTKEWFGDRPEMSASCIGKRCSLVQLNDGIAASWKRANRHITVIGIRDVTELTILVAWFDERQQFRLQDDDD